MRSRSSWAVLAFACSLIGCGGFAPDTGDHATLIGAGGSAGAGGVGGGAGAAGANTSANGGAAGSAGSSAGSAPVMACSSYADKTGYQLLVRIENKMSRTLYLGQQEQGCQAQRLFKVADGARAELLSLDNCHTSCDQMMAGGPVACPLACASPTTIKLDPSQALQIPWDGRYGVMQTLPQSCLKAAQAAPATCLQAERILPAIFTFSAQAGSSMQCLGPAGSCTCAPNQAGGCSSPSSVIGGTIYTTQYIVKLEPGEVSPGGEPPHIGLVFSDAAQ